MGKKHWTLRATHHDEIHTLIQLIRPDGTVHISDDTADDQADNLASQEEGIRDVAELVTKLKNRASGRKSNRDQGIRPHGPLHDPRDLLDLYGHYRTQLYPAPLTLEIDGVRVKDEDGHWIVSTVRP